MLPPSPEATVLTVASRFNRTSPSEDKTETSVRIKFLHVSANDLCKLRTRNSILMHGSSINFYSISCSIALTMLPRNLMMKNRNQGGTVLGKFYRLISVENWTPQEILWHEGHPCLFYDQRGCRSDEESQAGQKWLITTKTYAKFLKP